MTDTRLHAPWALHFDRDGTEDLGTICDSHGYALVTSRPFWLPEGDDPVPATLAALWAMTAAPELVGVLRDGLDTLLDVQRYGAGHDAPGGAAALAAHVARVRAVLVAADHGPASPTGPGSPEAIDPADPSDAGHDDSTGLRVEGADRADRAVRAFQGTARADGGDVLCDLLADLIHWADRHHFDFGAALFRAQDRYDAEARGNDR